MTIENSVPPIVEPEVFNRVQELLAINKKAKVDHLLFGKILTLHEIDGGSGHSIRIPSGFVHHAKKSVLKRTLFFFGGHIAAIFLMC